MKRTNIYFTERQRKELAKEAKKLGITPAELVRRILDAYLDNKLHQGGRL